MMLLVFCLLVLFLIDAKLSVLTIIMATNEFYSFHTAVSVVSTSGAGYMTYSFPWNMCMSVIFYF